MKNNIYEILNNKEFDFDKYERLEFNDIEKRKIKNNLNKSIKNKGKKYKRCAAIVVSVLTASILFFNTEVGVQALGSIKGSIERILKVQESLEDYKAVVDESKVDKEIEIKVSEAILDEGKLYIYNQISSNKKLSDDEYYYTSMDAYINDKKVEFGRHRAAGDTIDDYTIENLDQYELKNLEGIDLSGDINIKIVYTKAGISEFGEDPNSTEGKWEFNFKTNMEELRNRTKKGEVNSKFTIGNGGEITLESYKINPIEAVIYGKIEGQSHGDPYIVSLRGTDDLGNEVKFHLEGDSNQIEMESNLINPEAKYIKLTPYAMKFPEKNEKPEEEVKVGEEFVIYLK